MRTKIMTISLLMVVFILSSCENYRTRRLGGTMEVKLEPGEKLISATWKEENLFYLTEPMEQEYVPKVKLFREKSKHGLIESTVKFIESK